MNLVDLGIIVLIAYGAYAGHRRGIVLVAFELVSFVIATVAALALYGPLGPLLKGLAGITLPLANVGAFMIIWVVTETACALAARYLILPHVPKKPQFSWWERAGGSILNAFKSLVLMTVAVILLAGLPVDAALKQPVTDSYIAQALLGSSGALQQWLGNGLGDDLGQSLNVFTVTSQPDSEQTIDLGFKTTDVITDTAGEQTMLELTNQDRTSRGLKPLTLSEPARKVARAYSTRMLAEGYFSHKDPDGHNPFDRLKAANIKFGSAGENLALAPTAQQAQQGLMNSPGHRANILSKSYHKIGIGVIDAGPHGRMITEEFTD